MVFQEGTLDQYSQTSSLPHSAVVIGCSAGGLNALRQVLLKIPSDYPLPIVIVAHTSPNPAGQLADVLNHDCALHVHQAEEKEPIERGKVYVAPGGYHLLVEDDLTFSLSSDPKVLFSRPSLDVLFESMADAYEERLVGVVLTGANEDGSRGLDIIRQRGGLGIVQDPMSAHSPTMPRAAIDTGGADYVGTLDAIAERLVRIGEACR